MQKTWEGENFEAPHVRNGSTAAMIPNSKCIVFEFRCCCCYRTCTFSSLQFLCCEDSLFETRVGPPYSLLRFFVVICVGYDVAISSDTSYIYFHQNTVDTCNKYTSFLSFVGYFVIIAHNNFRYRYKFINFMRSSKFSLAIKKTYSSRA